MWDDWQEIADKCKTRLSKCKKRTNLYERQSTKTMPVRRNTTGLSTWRDFLNKYRSQNPNMSYREAQKQASILYKQR